MSHTTNLFKQHYILIFDDLLISRNILFLVNITHDNYNIDFKSYFIFNKDKNIFHSLEQPNFKTLYF